MRLAQDLGGREAGFLRNVIEDVGDLGADLRRPVGVGRGAAHDRAGADFAEREEIVFREGAYSAGSLAFDSADSCFVRSLYSGRASFNSSARSWRVSSLA